MFLKTCEIVLSGMVTVQFECWPIFPPIQLINKRLPISIVLDCLTINRQGPILFNKFDLSIVFSFLSFTGFWFRCNIGWHLISILSISCLSCWSESVWLCPIILLLSLFISSLSLISPSSISSILLEFFVEPSRLHQNFICLTESSYL